MLTSKLLIVSLLVMVFSIAVIYPSASAEGNIPSWVKNTAGWWATDAISEDEFVNAIEFLVNGGIIHVEKSSTLEKNIEFCLFVYLVSKGD